MGDNASRISGDASHIGGDASHIGCDAGVMVTSVIDDGSCGGPDVGGCGGKVGSVVASMSSEIGSGSKDDLLDSEVCKGGCGDGG
jgi:hypothetical protein